MAVFVPSRPLVLLWSVQPLRLVISMPLSEALSPVLDPFDMNI